MTRSIAILSDFGSSEYLGVMKGVAISINNETTIIDLYNNIQPHNIKQAAWLLDQTFEQFPDGTIFLCIVDPGVGTSRKAIALETTTNHIMVGPDNGLFWPLKEKGLIKRVVELTIPDSASSTFHGRDVFAPAAGKLSTGIDLRDLGKETSLTVPVHFKLDLGSGTCELVHVDYFGNLITNHPIIDTRARSYKVHYFDISSGEKSFVGNLPFCLTYNLENQETDLILVKGSYKTFEIAVPNGSAEKWLNIPLGTTIEIKNL
ncbi:MAG: SAM hydrolase/SAM-dependent halogenase family protein [Candidatus Hodarchaeales archaeon]|jgi:S-adenosylmethionine hydrolase